MYRGRITRIFEAPEDLSLRAVSARGPAAKTGATPFLWNRAPRLVQSAMHPSRESTPSC